ncbi:MAG: HDOD domain-containing protein [Proteobacteria bacterium]|nr:HDOD domain-containing protein [Pseudomonadota bacterium]
MDRLEAFRNIAAEAGRGDLVFPTNVNASLKIQQVLNDPDCHLDTASKLVMTEPLLSARTVAIANSVAYNRSGNEITNVNMAVMRLGFRTLRSLVAAVVVRQLGNKPTNPTLRAMSNQLWQHTAHVAALSHVIARKVTFVDPETAMFAGIVHEVGGFYLLSRAEEFPGLLDGDPEDWIEYGEKLIGRGVLKKLSVPEQVTEAVEALWYGFRAMPPVTLGDTLLLANDLAPVSSPLHARAGATTEQTATTIDFAVGEGTLHDILEESSEEVNTLTAALMF